MALHIVSPLLESSALSKRVKGRVFLKLDNVQPSGSFKIRGIGHLCEHLVHEKGCSHLVASSGGNAGLAVAYSARKLGVKSTIVVPTSTSVFMRRKLLLEDAEVIVHGSVWDEAHEKAMQIADAHGTQVVHPFDHPLLWEGHATLIREVKVQLNGKKPKCVVTVVGGGGLLIGIVNGLHEMGWSDVPVVAAETSGASSFAEAVKAGQLVTLTSITSIAKTLGARRVAEEAFNCTKRHFITPVVVDDRDALNAVISFQEDHQMLVEPSCGAGLSVLYNEEHRRVLGELEEDDIVLIVVCGGNAVTIDLIEEWQTLLGTK